MCPWLSMCIHVYPCVSMCIHVHREPKRDKRDWAVISLCKVQTCKQFVYLFELCLQLYILYFIFCVLICIRVILCYSVFHCLVRSTYYQVTLKSNWQRTALKTPETFGGKRPNVATQVCHPSFEVTRCWCLVTISWPWKSCPPESSRKNWRKGVELFFWFKAVWF